MNSQEFPDKDIFRWVKSIGAQELSLDASYKHHREMAASIWTVHKHLFFMRRLYGRDAAGYLHHMSQCQNALARIEFLCALNGNDTQAPQLSKMFMQMSLNELPDRTGAADTVDLQ